MLVISVQLMIIGVILSLIFGKLCDIYKKD